MGARHALTAMRVWSDLGHAPMRLLVHMALTTKDSDDHPHYYGGSKAKAAALGFDGSTRGSERAVERAMKALKDAGAVVMTRKQGPKHPPKYRLVLTRDTPRSAVGVPAELGTEHPPVLGRTPTGFGQNTPRSAVGRGVLGDIKDEETPVFTDLVTTDGTAPAEAEKLDESAPTRYHLEVTDADLRRYFEHEGGDDPKTTQRIDRLNACRANYRCTLADDDRRRDAIARAIDIGNNRRRHHVLQHVDTTHRHECPVYEGPRRSA